MDKHKEIKSFLKKIEPLIPDDDNVNTPIYVRLRSTMVNILELQLSMLTKDVEKFPVEICQDMIIDLCKIAFDTAKQDKII